LLEKTPDHIGYVPVIRSVFPDAKIVLIEREIKDSVASYIRHFNPRASLMNKYLPERMLLKKQVRKCLHYEDIASGMKATNWCYTVSYKQLIEQPFQTVCSVLSWLGLEMDHEKTSSLFVGRSSLSHWNSLSKKEQRLVNNLMNIR
jgi:hypothetical protein